MKNGIAFLPVLSGFFRHFRRLFCPLLSCSALSFDSVRGLIPVKDWEAEEAPAVGMAVKCRVVFAAWCRI